MKLKRIKRRRVREGTGGGTERSERGRGDGELEIEFIVWSAVWFTVVVVLGPGRQAIRSIGWGQNEKGRFLFSVCASHYACIT